VNGTNDVITLHVLLCVQRDMLVDDVWCDNQLSCGCLYPSRIKIGLVPLDTGANQVSSP
jgi:hypothetical protein